MGQGKHYVLSKSQGKIFFRTAVNPENNTLCNFHIR